MPYTQKQQNAARLARAVKHHPALRQKVTSPDVLQLAQASERALKDLSGPLKSKHKMMKKARRV